MSQTATGPLLVISHEATRTGAPRVLADLVGALKARTDVSITMHLEAGGPLAHELLALDDGPSVGPPAAVLVNSALAADAVDQAPGLPSAIYVHEERSGLERLPARARSALVERFDLVLCVSDHAAEDLAGMGIAAERLRVVPPLVPEPPAVEPAERAAVRSRMAADPDRPLILGCGECGWRKGTDLFVDLARLLATTEVQLAWVGVRPSRFARLLDHDATTTGIGDRIRWLGEVADARPFLGAADLVLVTSRYDPQPLVPVEAALLGTAAAGFGIGGMQDLHDAGAAATVPFPDGRALAGLVVDLLADSTRRDQLVARARERWETRQSPEAVTGLFAGIVEELFTR